MIINSAGSTKQTIGVNTEYKTSIDIENLDFIATLLSSNLYSNPEGSFIREIVSNGWDSHVEANNTDTPIIIKTKGDGLKYNITIRDYGTGLSKEDFENIYCKIGTSTKRLSNNYLGAFGVGKFSVMAVSNVSYITSYHNGVARQYIMTKDGNSITTNLISEKSTDEKNGLEISIKGINSLWKYEEGLKELAFFPNIYIDGLYNHANNIKVKRYKNFSVANAVFGKKLLLGNVLYPIDESIIPAELKDFYDSIMRSGVVFNFNIGEVQVTPNRESIIYNTTTTNLIIDRIKSAYKEISDILNPHINKDFDDPYAYQMVINSTFAYNFFTDVFDDHRDASPRFKVEHFPSVSPTLNGKKISTQEAYAITKCKGKMLNVKCFIYNSSISKTKADNWRMKNFIQESRCQHICIPKDQTLTKYVKEWLCEKYQYAVIYNEFSYSDYEKEYLNDLYNRTWLKDDEKHCIKACYNYLISRQKKITFDTPEFEEFKKTIKEEIKSNKVIDNSKVILTVQLPERCSIKITRPSYSEAIKYIKNLKLGVKFNNLDCGALNFVYNTLGYAVVMANKQVLDRLCKEGLKCSISENTLKNNKNIIIINTLYKLKEDVELFKQACDNYYFLDTITTELRQKVLEVLRTSNKHNIHVLKHYIQTTDLPVDEDLLKQLQDFIEMYKKYLKLTTELDITVGRDVMSCIKYLIMKEKLYKIGYINYIKVKDNKLLKKLCK